MANAHVDATVHVVVSGKISRPMFSATGLSSYLSFRKPQNLPVPGKLSLFFPSNTQSHTLGRFCELYDKFLDLSRAKYCGGLTTSALGHADGISAFSKPP